MSAATNCDVPDVLWQATNLDKQRDHNIAKCSERLAFAAKWGYGASYADWNRGRVSGIELAMYALLLAHFGSDADAGFTSRP